MLFESNPAPGFSPLSSDRATHGNLLSFGLHTPMIAAETSALSAITLNLRSGEGLRVQGSGFRV